MTDAEKIAEVAADGVADGMHIVSEQALAAEKATRHMNSAALGYLMLGLAAGAAAGAFAGYKITLKKLETKYQDFAADEIAAARQHYLDKETAKEAESSKGDLTQIVRERGYAVETEPEKPPMVVSPPEAVMDAAQDEEEVDDEEIDAVQPPDFTEGETPPEPEVRNVFVDAETMDTWDYHEERRNRSPLRPYVIHLDEREAQQTYDEVTLTYYDGDDVLCNERDEVMGKDERDLIVGEANLGKFGHGSNDATIVYIRNDRLEIDFEVIRSPNSYAEEVHGFEPEIRHSIRRGKHQFDDE